MGYDVDENGNFQNVNFNVHLHVVSSEIHISGNETAYHGSKFKQAPSCRHVVLRCAGDKENNKISQNFRGMTETVGDVEENFSWP